MRLPHTRGGVSNPFLKDLEIKQSSPHSWGCFTRCWMILAQIVVFPTHAGVLATVGGKVVVAVTNIKQLFPLVFLSHIYSNRLG